MGRADGAGREDDFVRCGMIGLSVSFAYDADGALSIKEDPVNLAIRLNMQVRAAPRRIQITDRGTVAQPLHGV